MKKVAFCGGQIFNSNSETFVQANILCEDGYIKDITRGSVPYDYEIIDVDGNLWIVNGLQYIYNPLFYLCLLFLCHNCICLFVSIFLVRGSCSSGHR